jgi:IS5 family transposase
VYSDLLVLRMWLWAVMHDRPLSWACRRDSYGSAFRPRRLPSVSRFSRRLRTMRFLRSRVLLHRVLVAHGRGEALSFLDGKALAVGECTTDPDARDGVVTTGRFRKGYKLHARANAAGIIEEYRVTPLNAGEAKVARGLVRGVPAGGVVLADANYDARKLYAAIERRRASFLAPVKGVARAKSTLRRMPESRRQAVRLWQQRRPLAERAMSARSGVERVFAHLCGFGGGLGPLPAWVRRLGRVRLWLDAKIAVYHARLIARNALKEMG